MAGTLNTKEGDRITVFWLLLTVVLALLAIELWTFTETAYAKQEVDDRIMILMLAFGGMLFVGSCFIMQRHPWLGSIGILCSLLALVLFSWWRFVPQAIID